MYKLVSTKLTWGLYLPSTREKKSTWIFFRQTLPKKILGPAKSAPERPPIPPALPGAIPAVTPSGRDGKLRAALEPIWQGPKKFWEVSDEKKSTSTFLLLCMVSKAHMTAWPILGYIKSYRSFKRGRKCKFKNLRLAKNVKFSKSREGVGPIGGSGDLG